MSMSLPQVHVPYANGCSTWPSFLYPFIWNNDLSYACCHNHLEVHFCISSAYILCCRLDTDYHIVLSLFTVMLVVPKRYYLVYVVCIRVYARHYETVTVVQLMFT